MVTEQANVDLYFRYGGHLVLGFGGSDSLAFPLFLLIHYPKCSGFCFVCFFQILVFCLIEQNYPFLILCFTFILGEPPLLEGKWVLLGREGERKGRKYLLWPSSLIRKTSRMGSSSPSKWFLEFQFQQSSNLNLPVDFFSSAFWIWGQKDS